MFAKTSTPRDSALFTLPALVLCGAFLHGMLSASLGQEMPAARSDLATLRDDPAVLISLEFGKHWRGPERETLQRLSAAHPAVITSELSQLEQAFGISPEQIDRVTVAFEPLEGPQVFVVLPDPKLADPFLKRLTHDAPLKSIGAHSIRVSDQSGYAAGLVDDRTVVAGPQACVEKLFDGAAPPARNEPLQQFCAEATKSPLLIVQIRVPKFRPGLAEAADTPFGPLIDAVSWRVAAEAQHGLTVTLRAEFADAAAAKAAEEPLRQVVAELEKYFKLAEERMLPMFEAQTKQFPNASVAKSSMAKALGASRQALQTATFEVRGNSAQGVVKIATEEPAATAVALLTLMPRAAKSSDPE